MALNCSALSFTQLQTSETVAENYGNLLNNSNLKDSRTPYSFAGILSFSRKVRET